MIYLDFNGRRSKEMAAPQIHNKDTYHRVTSLTVSSSSLLRARTCCIPLKALFGREEKQRSGEWTHSTTTGLPLTLSEWEDLGLVIKMAGPTG